MCAGLAHGHASYKLKQLNKAKRAARPAPNTSDTNMIEYLYAREYCWSDGNPCSCETLTGMARWNYHIQKFQILKKTKQRIYYNSKPLPFEEKPDEYSIVRDMTDYGNGFVNQQTIEHEGKVWSGRRHLYLCPPPPPDHWWRDGERTPPADIRRELHHLKAEMAAAHPDKGGSSAAFIAARKAYTEAVKRLKHLKRGAA